MACCSCVRAANVHFSKNARDSTPVRLPAAGQPPSVARPVTAVNTLAERDNSRARPEPVGLRQTHEERPPRVLCVCSGEPCAWLLGPGVGTFAASCTLAALTGHR